MMRALIVDDEPIARRVLREELELVPDVTVIGEAQNGQDAIERIVTTNPHIVFLDLEMPVMNGFDVVRKLDKGHLPVIVIVTAYDQHAIQAFEAGAIDYLLKPVGQARLSQSLDRARHLLGSSVRVAENIAKLQEIAGSSSKEKLRKVVGKKGAEYFVLNTNEILAFQADGDLVWIITAKQKYLATQTLKAIQAKLVNTSFERVHRNALVNIDHIRKMSALSSQRWLITLSNNQEFIVSKRQAHNARHILNW